MSRKASSRLSRTRSTISRPGVINQNGLLIIQALQDLNKPATTTDLVRQLAIRTNLAEQDIRRTVRITLREAVKYGFVQQVRGKHCILPTNVSKDPETVVSVEAMLRAMDLEQQLVSSSLEAGPPAVPSCSTFEPSQLKSPAKVSKRNRKRKK